MCVELGLFSLVMSESARVLCFFIAIQVVIFIVYCCCLNGLVLAVFLAFGLLLHAATSVDTTS